MSKRLSILVVSSCYPTPLKPQNGVFVRNFCVGLASAGHQVTVLVADGLHNYARYTPRRRRVYDTTYSDDPLQVYHIGYLSFGRLVYLSAAASKLDQIFYSAVIKRKVGYLGLRPDIIYAHFIGNGLGTLKVAREINCPIIVISGESSYDHFLKRYQKDELRRAVENFHKLLFVSETSQLKFTRFLGIKNTIGDVLPNAVDTTTFAPTDRNLARSQLGLPLNERIVIFVGHFNDRKGVVRLIDAVDKLPNTKLLLIGKGSLNSTNTNILRQTAVQHTDMPKYLNAADVFCLPSLHEGRANATLEAAACGLPIVVSDRPFNTDFLDETNAVFVDPNDSIAIAKAINSLFEQPRTMQRLGENARLLALKYSTKNKVENFIEIASEVSQKPFA